ncbi:NAD(P)H-binding protein [Kibdelosporangium phytohabitans]|uniref:NAD-dependent dehydratase n=1 Tax=Kibdelosporangium phytohabitans TaxID=860235 RepID=A0A0N7F4F3_9PSEU|nr:NAD(P)H-binding protein [Kibdelosporangium phytohabitans]ALG11271.1 NAD-dependent dehydratase [Kibdelosporangium phytohabitans]MBE1462561.1 nucleoside-diphosphate-sugar epimerase [Kibdelosporangium phytohabitans]
MKVVIAGGHGKVALRLTRILATRGDDVVGLVRDPSHVDDVRQAGGDAVVLDLEHATVDEVAAALNGADAAVFSAGSGSNATAARRDKMDRAAVVLLMDAAERAGVRRFVHVSSINVGCADSPGIGEGYSTYLRAKHAAEQHIFARDGLDWTVLRPGVLTDDDGADAVELTAGNVVAPKAPRFDEVARDDVAAVLVALLDRPGTAGRIYFVVGGNTPIAQAFDA